jgi:hypothetical protein
MKKILLISLFLFISCGDGSGYGNEVSSNSNSNNSSVITTSGSGVICSRCETEAGLFALGYEVESFQNCTDLCGLPAQGDPEKVQCDRDCIADRLDFASELCKADNGCQ